MILDDIALEWFDMLTTSALLNWESKMVMLEKIVTYLDECLDTANIKDDSWNGLQVEGNAQVSKIMFAVDAGIETIERAIKENANMIVVHHGHFWRLADPSIRKWSKKRIDLLLKNGISLYASHLPLDKHSKLGNNAQLLKLLGFDISKEFGGYHGETISFIGKSEQPKTLSEIEFILTEKLSATCKVLPFGNKQIKTIAVCSGGGADFSLFSEAVDAGVDLYLTGDSTEMYHLAKDIGINVIFAGHHATEIVGVKALSEHIKEKFDVETLFVDIPTGL